MHAEYRSKLVSANAAHESAFDEYRADGKQTLTLRWLWKVVEQLAPYGAYCAHHEKDRLSMNAFSPRLNRKGTLPRAARASVSMPASVVTMSAYQFPELADISQTGAKLRGSPFPPKGTTALLRAGALEVLCRVVWVQDDHCGIRFDEPVSPKILKQVQLDGAVALDTFGPVGED